ncbi:MAG TPA: hypothetical protein VF727_11735 [Allosphingosinicella sp.]|jgi:hypothetical protein
MPRFYFHVCNGDGFTPDEEGSELPDAETARAEAVRSARSLMSDELRDGFLNLSSFIEVEAEGEHLFTVTFEEAVKIAR